MRRLTKISLLAAGVLICAAYGAHASAQRFGQLGQFGLQPSPTDDPFGRFRKAPLRVVSSDVSREYEGHFQFCRVRFRNSLDGDGSGWFVDYPRADENLSSRLSELTKTFVPLDEQGRPRHRVITLTDPNLYECPFVVMTEPGGAYFDEEEAEQLRIYLMKGGMLWADDSWGSDAWEWWTEQIGHALPRNEYPIVDLPMDHPLFHTMFDIDHVPQIPNVGLWVQRHLTSERGADSPLTPPRAIFEPGTKRVMVFMTHNTDFGDAYEEEAVSPDYFKRFSVQAYAIGADLVLYAMTH